MVVLEDRVAGQQPDVVAAELLARDRGLGRDDRARAVEQLLDRLALGLLDPRRVQDVQRARGELLQDGLAQGLRRDRPGMDRDAAEAVAALGDGDALAELGGLDGRALAAGPRADDEKIELHGRSLPKPGSAGLDPGYSLTHMFDSLSEKLQGTLAGVRQRGALTEDDINKAMREIRLALLEADVNFKVVKQFTIAVKERALGIEITKQLNPGQQVIKIVNDELTSLMGGAVGGDHVLAAAADRDPDGRPAGLGQDDRDGQAGEAAARAEQVVASPSPPATSTARRPSSSWSRSARRRARRSTSRAPIATPSTSPAGRSIRPSATARTS